MLTRTRTGYSARPFAAVLAAGLLAAPSFAQNPELTATYLGPVAKDNFAFKWKDKGSFNRAVCRMGWEVPSTQLSTGGLDRNFGTYCAEALLGVVAGRTYGFQLQSIEVPEMYGLPDDEAGRAEAVRRARYVRELYGRYYPASIRDNDPDATRAFQVALWELLHESQFVAAAPVGAPVTLFGVPLTTVSEAVPVTLLGIPLTTVAENATAVPPPFSLITGNFQADYPDLAQAPVFVQRAEGYLQSLTGDENLFWQTLAGRELVRLKALPGEAGEAAAQSQLALRYTRGGAAGMNGALASAAPVGGLGAGGVGPLAGGGFPGGGFGGGGFGGGGGFPGVFPGGGGSPNTIVPNVPVGGTSSGSTPPGSSTTPPGVVPPVNASTSSTTSSGQASSTSGTTSGVTSTTSSGGAIPAPPGILLGAVLLGALAGRRLLGQLNQHKDAEKPQD